MASFSRGLWLPGLRRAALSFETPIVRSRFFTTTFLRHAAQPSTKAVRSPAARSAPKAPSGHALSRYAFIKSLATKTTPTTLYEGPSHFWFYFGCWSSSISILAWTALTGPAAVHQPEGIPQWVGLVFGASYLLLASMGFYLITKTPNIVGRIRVLPGQLGKQAASGTTGPLPLQMEITVKRMIPFMKPKVLTTSLENVTLQSRFSLPEEYVPQLKRLQLERAEEARKKALRKFDMEHLLTMPFRRMGRAFAGLFNGVKSAWTDMGYGIIKVDGKSYKVDVTKGFAHEGFGTLEKLVEIKA